MKSGKRYGIMGGTFDPIHLGHLVTAEAARIQYGFEKVIFVPSGQPPHKNQWFITPASHRYIMCVLATATNEAFYVSSFEVERPGPSYTVDTITHFHDMYGEDGELYFITGADAIAEILTWKDVDRLLDLCHFVGATRPGYHLNALDQVLQTLGDRGHARIHRIATPEIAISSTDIRRRLQENESIKYLVPENVEDYIYKQGLYIESGK